jgi:hypothetical protein
MMARGINDHDEYNRQWEEISKELHELVNSPTDSLQKYRAYVRDNLF